MKLLVDGSILLSEYDTVKLASLLRHVYFNSTSDEFEDYKYNVPGFTLSDHALKACEEFMTLYNTNH